MLHALRASRPIQLFVGAALLLVALVAVVGWHYGAPRRALSQARSSWSTASVAHYRIVVRMQGWGGCLQDAEVRHERVVAVAANSCRYHNPRTVTALFAETERFLNGPELGSTCRRGLPGRDCTCFAPFQTVAEYDHQYGFPRQVQVTVKNYVPNRLHLDYWRFVLRNGREPTCGGPVEPAGRHLVIERFEPLP